MQEEVQSPMSKVQSPIQVQPRINADDANLKLEKDFVFWF
jgi:hypothetical protein